MKQTPVKYGIIAGALMVAYLLLLYVVEVRYFLSVVMWSALLIPVIAMVQAVKKERNESEERLTKKAAIRSAFLTWAIAMVIFHIFIYLMFTVIDPGLVDVQREIVAEVRGEEEATNVSDMTFGQVFFQLSFMLLPGFLFAYMVSALVRR